MMATREGIGHVTRDGTDNPRGISGMLVPYNMVSRSANIDGRGTIGREVIQRGAAAASVAAWMGAKDGRRMPFRARHGERPNGVVTEMTDTPDGVLFRASIFDTPAGDQYLAEVDAGLNAVSPEFEVTGNQRPGKDGIYVQREIALLAVAGSDMPAYDGARVALRDTESEDEDEMDKDTQEPKETAPEPSTAATEDVARDAVVVSRSALEKAGLTAIAGSRINITRPEATYTPATKGNYLSDWYNGMLRGDGAAAERYNRHVAHLTDVVTAQERDAAARIFDPSYAERAGDLLSSEIPGAYPTDYLPGLLTPRIFKGRPMADFYGRVPIADARPRTFPKVTTSTVVAVQSAEGAAPSTTDLATTAVSVTPSAYAATIDVSRQVLDGADPSATAMVFQDMLEAYRQVSEGAVKTAVEAGSTDSGVAITAATPFAGALANVVNYYGTRFTPARRIFIPPAAFSTLLSQADTTGRPFLPQLGPTNSDGSVNVDGEIVAPILNAQGTLSWQSTTNVWVFGVATDFVIYESGILQFQYEQVVGPQAVRMGVWAYLGIGTRLGSLKRTAA